MFRGRGTTSSVIHAAGPPGAGVSARPNALVRAREHEAAHACFRGLLEQRQRPGHVGVHERLLGVRADMRLVQRRRMEDARRLRPGSGARRPGPRLIRPRPCVGLGLRSTPVTSCPPSHRTRTSASPRCPALPVTITRTAASVTACEEQGRMILPAGPSSPAPAPGAPDCGRR